MALTPLYIKNYRQLAQTLKVEDRNLPKELFSPARYGSRVLSMTLSHEGYETALIEFGVSDLMSQLPIQVILGENPLKDPWKICGVITPVVQEKEDKFDQKYKKGDLLIISGPFHLVKPLESLVLKDWPTGFKKNVTSQTGIDLSPLLKDSLRVQDEILPHQSIQNTQNLGDFKVLRVTKEELYFKASKKIREEEKSFATLTRWFPLGRFRVPKRAGYDGNPSLSILDPQKAESFQTIFTWPLYAKRILEDQKDQGNIYLNTTLGDF